MLISKRFCPGTTLATMKPSIAQPTTKILPQHVGIETHETPTQPVAQMHALFCVV
jgi:hypothetical protein